MTRGRSATNVWIAALAAMVCAGPAAAVNDLTLNVPGPLTVQPGDTVTVELNVANLAVLDAINGAQVFLNYDTTIMTLTAISSTRLNPPPLRGRPAWNDPQMTVTSVGLPVALAGRIRIGPDFARSLVICPTFTAS